MTVSTGFPFVLPLHGPTIFGLFLGAEAWFSAQIREIQMIVYHLKLVRFLLCFNTTFPCQTMLVALAPLTPKVTGKRAAHQSIHYLLYSHFYQLQRLFAHLMTLVPEKCQDSNAHGVAIAAAQPGIVGVLQ